MKENYYLKLKNIAEGRRKKFPEGNNPFKNVSRLCEEAGELAKAINHYEKQGSKVRRYGEIDKTEIAKEAVDVIQNVLAIILDYNLQPEFEHEIEESEQRLVSGGYLEKI
jgi:NTP pyrophosphatase (non-canonical NTP hydrolase)